MPLRRSYKPPPWSISLGYPRLSDLDPVIFHLFVARNLLPILPILHFPVHHRLRRLGLWHRRSALLHLGWRNANNRLSSTALATRLQHPLAAILPTGKALKGINDIPPSIWDSTCHLHHDHERVGQQHRVRHRWCATPTISLDETQWCE